MAKKPTKIQSEIPGPTQPLPDTPTFTFLNKETGLLETRHAITGDLLAIQSTYEPMLVKGSRAATVVVNGKELLVEPGISADRVNHTGRPTQWVYSTLVGETIAQLIAEGGTLTGVCGTRGIPPYTIVASWRKKNSSFDEMIKQAFIDRSEWHRDRALKLAEEADEDDVQSSKLKVDTHKWAAGVDNSNRFGTKTKVEGEVKHSHFMIDTGIRRPEDSGYLRDETRLVHDIKPIAREKIIEQRDKVETRVHGAIEQTGGDNLQRDTTQTVSSSGQDCQISGSGDDSASNGSFNNSGQTE